jgi:hypothetical protein
MAIGLFIEIQGEMVGVVVGATAIQREPWGGGPCDKALQLHGQGPTGVWHEVIEVSLDGIARGGAWHPN